MTLKNKDKVKLVWDGDNIKQLQTISEHVHTPKEIIEGIEQAKNHLDQFVQQEAQLKENLKQLKNNQESIKEYIKRFSEFESKCNDILIKKLKDIIKAIGPECEEKAIKTTKETIDKDPNAYTQNVKDNMNYVNYQRFLAIHEKTAKKIPASMIQELLFNKPIFENPFNKD
jgi:predicted nuclease with TOPRIM domain